MRRTGRVVSSQDGRVAVCFERPEACARCGACAGGKHHTQVTLPGTARVGDFVDVEMPDAQVVKASLLAYAVPLAALLLGILAGTRLFEQEALWALSGITLMGVAWAALRLIDRRMRAKRNWQPRIVATYQEGEMNHGTDADQGKL